MALGTVTVNITIPEVIGQQNPDQAGRLIACSLLDQAKQALGSLVATSGNLTYNAGAGNVTAGTWSYTLGTT